MATLKLLRREWIKRNSGLVGEHCAPAMHSEWLCRMFLHSLGAWRERGAGGGDNEGLGLRHHE